MAWTAAGVQSGTDTSLAGITAVTGVTVNVTTLGVKVYNVPASVALLTINGNWSWNPDLECLVTSDGTRVEQNTGSSVTIGAQTTVNGKIRFSRGTGLIMNRQQAAATSGTNASNWWVKNGASFTLNGGQVKTAGGFFFGSSAVVGQTASLTINGRAEIMNIHNSLIMQVIRSFSSASFININSVIFSGLNFASIPFSSAGFGTLSVESDFNSFQSDGNGQRDPVTVLNPVFVDNKADRDYTYVAFTNSTNNVNKYLFRNSDVGSALRTAGQSPTTWRIGVAELSKDVRFAVSDADGNDAADVVTYMKLNGASINPSGRYAGIDDYVTPRVYVATTGSNGQTTEQNILYAVAQSYATDATNAGQPLPMESLTSRSGDVHTASIGGYAYLPAQPTVAMRGVDTNTVSWTVFDDVNVTLSRSAALALLGTKFTIDSVAKTITVTANADYDELYDATKAFKYNGTAANFETPTANALIMTPNGQNLDAFNGWALIVNNGVTLAQGTKFNRIKFTTITLNGNGQITGVYESNAGVSTAWSFEDIVAGSTIAVWDSSNVTKYFLQVTTDGDYTLYIPPGVVDTYNFAIERYGFQREEGTFPANAGGGLFYVPKYVEDVGITETNQSTVAAYTDLDTGEKLYDYIAVYRLSEDGIKRGQIATRAGNNIEFGVYSGLMKSTHSPVLTVVGNLITFKSGVLNGTPKYGTIVANLNGPTWTSDTNEIYNIEIEDSNGDSSVTIQAGSVSTFEIWKITDATDPDDYDTGTLLDTVGPGKYRFIGETGFNLVIRDQLTNYRVVVDMTKGVYTAELFFGAQVQLAQSATVEQIYTLLQLVDNDIDAIKGVGFTTTKDSLVKIRKKAALAAALSA